jgi:hypothetical protein
LFSMQICILENKRTYIGKLHLSRRCHTRCCPSCSPHLSCIPIHDMKPADVRACLCVCLPSSAALPCLLSSAVRAYCVFLASAALACLPSSAALPYLPSSAVIACVCFWASAALPCLPSFAVLPCLSSSAVRACVFSAFAALPCLPSSAAFLLLTRTDRGQILW